MVLPLCAQCKATFERYIGKYTRMASGCFGERCYPLRPIGGNAVDAATRSRSVLLGLLGYALLRHLMTGTPEGIARAAIEEGER